MPPPYLLFASLRIADALAGVDKTLVPPQGIVGAHPGPRAPSAAGPAECCRHCCAQVNSGFFYSSAEQRERLVRAERQVTTERVQKIIDLKREARIPGVLLRPVAALLLLTCEHASADRVAAAARRLRRCNCVLKNVLHAAVTLIGSLANLLRSRGAEYVSHAPTPGRRCATARRSRSC